MLIASSVAVLILLAGCVYQAWGAARDRGKFPPSGRLVRTGAIRLHFTDSGAGNPTVVLESGLAASHLSWSVIQTELSKTMRVCAYDRASLGWSDQARSPRLLSTVLDELHQLLIEARAPAPYVLAGHSFGGLLVRCYAARYPERVAGLILVDPLAATEWMEPSAARATTLRRGASLARRGALLARLGVVRFALALLSRGGRGVPKLVARVSSSAEGESTISRVLGEVRKMPPETWPVVRALWCLPKCFLGLASYLECLPASSAEAAAIGFAPARIPVTILSASSATAEQIAERDTIAAHSNDGKHTIAQNSGHWVHLDEPDLVVQAIREMAERVCADGAAHSR